MAETEGVTGFPEIVEAENYVIDHNLGDVITQSFGATEETFPSKGAIFGLRSAFQNALLHGVTVLGSSGDTGSTDYKLNLVDLYDHQVNSWPSSDPLVTSVGGTQLHLDAAGNRLAPDNVWNDIAEGIDAAGGGGPSHVFPRPPFQLGTRTGSGFARATPDISLSAAVDGGVLVYLSFPGLDPGYYIVGGTSEASPLFSGVVAIADQIAGHRLGLDQPAAVRQSAPTANKGIVDVTSATTRSPCSTTTGTRSSPSPASRPSRATTWRAASARSTPRRSSRSWPSGPAPELTPDRVLPGGAPRRPAAARYSGTWMTVGRSAANARSSASSSSARVCARTP